MIAYLGNRLCLGFITLFGVAAIVFVLMRVLPGDAVVMMTGAEAGTMSPAELDELRGRLGIDQPMIVQFGKWTTELVRLDLGTSIKTGNPVISDIAARFPYTLQVIVLATVMAASLGIVLGVLSAALSGSWLDQGLRLFAVIGLAAPSFWVGLLIILGLVWFFGWRPPLIWEPLLDDPWTRFTQLFWPALAVGLRKMALVARMTRSTMLDILGEDYIRTARAKGLPEVAVVMRHGFRNALMPITTLIGLEVSALFGGLIVTETVFNVPGLGSYVVSAILNRDYPAAQGSVIILAFIVVLSNLLVDILYGVLDPRTRPR